MTAFDDPIKQGRAYYARAGNWQPNNQWYGNTSTTTINSNVTEARGVPHSQTITYEIGTASTSLATGISVTTPTGGTITPTGSLVTAGVATLDVPRAIQLTASSDFSTCIITIVGTDGYLAPMAVKMIGPTGNTLGNNGSFVFSPAAFKTITSASMTGTGGTALQIGTAPVFGLPFRIANVGKMLSINVNGLWASATSTAGFSTTAAGGVVGPVYPGFAATGTHTASSADVRGMVNFPTTNLPDGSKRLTIHFISPNVGITEAADTAANSYGLTPATG